MEVYNCDTFLVKVNAIIQVYQMFHINKKRNLITLIYLWRGLVYTTAIYIGAIYPAVSFTNKRRWS